MAGHEAILQRLGSEGHRRTRSEELVARFLAANLDELPFETAASIARRVGVSPVTVGRFLRSLGYRGLSDLKDEIRYAPANSAWRSKRAEGSRSGNGSESAFSRQLAAHIRNLTSVFAMVDSAAWADAVRLLTEADAVFVASFQNSRGVGLYFASQLRYARARVSFVDGSDGTFLEAFENGGPEQCLVVIDTRRYARKAGAAARLARDRGMKVIAVTDIYCRWNEQADVALTDPGEGEVFWDSAVSTLALLELLIESVVERLGGQAEERLATVAALQDAFGDYE